MGITDDDILHFEVSMIAGETLQRHFRWENEKSDRSFFAEVQVVYCCKLMELMMENPEVEEDEIIEVCEESLELQRDLLEKARAEDDRKWMLITLARIRFIKTLLRRLQTPGRRAVLLAGDPDNLIVRPFTSDS